MPKSKKLQEYSQPAGSPPSGEPLFLVVGKLMRPHGLHGEIIMEVITDFPERLKAGVKVYIGEDHFPSMISQRRGHPTGMLISFEGYETPERAGELTNQYVYVEAGNRPPLPEGDYYHHQLLGLNVVTEDGQPLGQLSGILETGANDVYVVRLESGKELLLPHITSVVQDIDLAKGIMRVHLLPGLLPD